MFLARAAVALALFAGLALAAGVALVVADAPMWAVYVTSAALVAVVSFRVVMPASGPRLGRGKGRPRRQTVTRLR